RRPGGARQAGRAERGLRTALRLPLRRVRERPAAPRDRSSPRGAPATDARRGTDDCGGRARADRARSLEHRALTHVVALSDYWWGWGNLLFRWLHVIAA